jgi:hypothetical protein
MYSVRGIMPLGPMRTSLWAPFSLGTKAPPFCAPFDDVMALLLLTGARGAARNACGVLHSGVEGAGGSLVHW